jgi:predicted RNA-binding Zn ribbon-like protein
MLVSLTGSRGGRLMTTVDLPKPDVPGLVAVVRDFVNTTDHETGIDDLATPADLTRYLRSAGLAARTARADDADLALAHRLRAGLRRALEANHDGTSTPARELRSALRDLPVRMDWSVAGAVLQPTEGGVRGALARIALAAHQCSVEGTWWRLKICASSDCAWAYYDHSKNRSRNWCEYGCGNKIKTRAYRARQRSAADA